MVILKVENISTVFHTRQGVVKAVDQVSFQLQEGEVLGIVGESGSGKTALCLSLLGLIPQPPGSIIGGTVEFEGTDLLALSEKGLNRIRGSRICMIFQDPMTSLNPTMRISHQLSEPLIVHEGVSKKKALHRSIEALEEVEIPDAAKRIYDYPFELSGGMRQRVLIAMALITRPAVVIADEPTTALDATVQLQVLERLRDLQRKRGMAFILITHDLGVIARMSDSVRVMYAGKVIESASVTEFFAKPAHPYSSSLMRSMPYFHTKGSSLYTIPGTPPSLLEELPGCAFASRCSHANEMCRSLVALEELTPEHYTACRRVQKGEIHV